MRRLIDQLMLLAQMDAQEAAATATDHASPDGAGLGLAIVDGIMQVHGGAIITDPENSALILDFS